MLALGRTFCVSGWSGGEGSVSHFWFVPRCLLSPRKRLKIYEEERVNKSFCSEISLKYGASRWQDCREMDRLVRNGAWKPFLRHRDTCIASIICFLHTLKRHTLNVKRYTTIIEFRLGVKGNSLRNSDRSVSIFFGLENRYLQVLANEFWNLKSKVVL